MLDPDVTEIGVAIAQSEESQYFYAVQVFGRPKSLSIAFQFKKVRPGNGDHFAVTRENGRLDLIRK